MNEDPNERSISGVVACGDCGHHWDVVSRVGEHQFHCRKCDAPTGRWVSSVMPPMDSHVWGCDCGCIAFAVGPEGFFCLKCGRFHPKVEVAFSLN